MDEATKRNDAKHSYALGVLFSRYTGDGSGAWVTCGNGSAGRETLE